MMADAHPFTRKDGRRFAVALAVVLAGYVLLSMPPADGICSLTLAPALLVLGYCVLAPWAILGGTLAKRPEDAPEGSSRACPRGHAPQG